MMTVIGFVNASDTSHNYLFFCVVKTYKIFLSNFKHDEKPKETEMPHQKHVLFICKIIKEDLKLPVFFQLNSVHLHRPFFNWL